MTATKRVSIKPQNRKAYSSILHLPGSRTGISDKTVDPNTAWIMLNEKRDRDDYIIVEEKLDGSCTAVANIDGEIVALTRSGYRASDSPYMMHHVFYSWVEANKSVFEQLVRPHERIVGEWMFQAHGTIYDLVNPNTREGTIPWVAFDICYGSNGRVTRSELLERINTTGKHIPTPKIISSGKSMSLAKVEQLLGFRGFHGSLAGAEGVVYRVERMGRVDMIAKYVRHGKIDGCYLDTTKLNRFDQWKL